MQYLKYGLAALLLAVVACAPKAGSDGGETGTGDGDCELVADPLCYETAFDWVCNVFGCGGRTGSLDENGCKRQLCDSDADCPDGGRCYVIALDEPGWKPSGQWCGLQDGECTCGGTDDYWGVLEAHCIPAAEYPPEGDCDLSGHDCSGLSEWAFGVALAELRLPDEGASTLVPALMACHEKISAARMAEPCNESACQLLCETGEWCSTPAPSDCVSLCETSSADAAPGVVEALLTAVIQHPQVCWTCEACPHAGDTGGLCEALFGC